MRGRVNGRRPARPPIPRGVTLIELLVVIVLLAFLLGIAVTMFRSANRDLGVRAATHHVVALLRAAGEHARAERSPVEVVLDLQERSVSVLSQETAGMWHFEDESGAFGLVPVPANVDTAPGYLGRAFVFKGSSTVSCGVIPVHAPGTGIAIDLYLNRSSRVRAAAGRRQIVCGIDGEVDLGIDPMGRVSGRVGGLSVDSGGVLLKPDRWYHVEMIHNTRELRLYVNDLEVGRKAGAASWSSKGPFVIGARQSGFVGMIDEVRVGLILPRDTYVLPPETVLELPQGVTPVDRRWFTIWFDGRGRLDPRHHASGVSVTLRSPADAKTVAVNAEGNVLR